MLGNKNIRNNNKEQFRQIPLVAIRGSVVFPHTDAVLSFGRKKSVAAVNSAFQEDRVIGIFAQRAKHRPNPIGITTVPILSIKNNILTVQGLDAIDGTPVLDIKPYFPMSDQVDARTPPWVDELMKGYFK